MGNGASQKLSVHENDDQQRVNGDYSDDDGYDDHRQPPQRKPEPKPKTKTSIFSRNKSSAKDKKKSEPKIVGLEESDDDDSNVNKLNRGKGKKNNDEKLKEDLDDLDRTFNSLGLVGKQLWKDDDYSEENTRNFASSDRWDRNVDGRPDNEFLNSSYANHTRFPRGAGHGHKSVPPVNGHGRGAGGGGGQRAIKFSWQDGHHQGGQADRGTEDWKYTKTVIDGFDPDKFRKVNKNPGGDTSTTTAPSRPALQPPTVRANSLPPPRTNFAKHTFNEDDDDDDGIGGNNNMRYGGSTMDLPGAAVPTYDRTEQQLLQTLEQELGVL